MAEETTTDTPSQTSADLSATTATPDTEPVDPRVLASAPINVTTTEVTSNFEDWGLAPELLQGLSDMGYERPMPVQEAVFKVLSEGKDLMVQSKTGSGKTAAFSIPIAQRLADGKKGVQSLILAPTRELAMQVAKETEKITAQMDVTVVPVYGGAPINPQIKKLEEGAQIVAGTPGRVLDHIRRRTLDTSGIRMLVLDECDEMLSMGFQEEIENIISTLPGKDTRQTLLFSATIPKEIERIGRRHMNEPEMVSLSSDSVGADLIDHYYYVVSGMARTRDLLKLMKSERPESAIIFCNTREETSTVARYLCRHGYDAEHLSSDLSQSDRERVMGRMKNKNLNFLVATDIAARGIDISELSHVINYTFPGSPEVYVHRSGRTGRAGRQGTALSLVGPREIGAFYYLKLIYKIIPTERDLPTAEEMATLEEGEQYQKIIEQVEGTPKSEYLSLAKRLWQSNEGERVVALLLQELVTNKSAAPKKAASTAATPSAEPAKAPAAAESATPDREDGRKRRRRRRGSSDEESASDIKAEPVSTASTDATPSPQPAQKDAPIEVAAGEESTGDAEPTARPKRKRRRRSAANDAVPAAEASVEAAAPEAVAAPEEAVPAKEASESEATAAPEPTADPDTIDTEHESLKAAEPAEEKPKRKRRRRGAKAAESEESVEATESAETSDKEEKKEAAPEKKASKPEAKKSRSKKSNSTKGNSSPGVHAEFWEAWAETKDEDTNSPEDSEAPEAPEAKAEAAETPEADEAAPTKKRRSRRRRRSKEDEVEEEESAGEDIPDGVRVFVNVGRREDADADEIRAFLVDALGESSDELGKLTLRNTHCYIRVPEAIVDSLIEACTGLKFHERDVVVERAKR